MKRIVILSCCLIGMLANPAFSAKVYTWTDAQGGIHYGEHPPKDVKATLVQTRTGHSDVTPPPAQSPAQVAEEEKQAQAASLKNPTRCAEARKNIGVLKTSPRIKMKDEKGNLRFLTDAEKQKKFEEMQAIEKESCN